ncbi:MAG: hypothetical protein WBA54_13210 [Acidaminobacteraceae bacterium]
MKNPVLINKNYDNIIESLKKKSLSFTPEWRFDDENPDLGSILAAVYSKQVEETVEILNSSVENYYRTFLNFSSPVHKVATPAIVPVSFNVAIGQKKPILLHAGTELEAISVFDERVKYITDDDLWAYPLAIEKILYMNKKLNSYYSLELDESSNVSEPEDIFDNFVLFKSSLLFGLEKEVVISLRLSNKEFEARYIDQLETYVRWEFLSGTLWTAFDKVEYLENQIKLYKNNELNIDTYFPDEEEDNQYNIRAVIVGNSETLRELYIINPQIFIEQINFMTSNIDYCKINDKITTSEKIAPFNELYNAQNSIDIISNTCFSKKNALIKLSFNLSIEDVVESANTELINWKLIMKKSEFDRMRRPVLSIFKVNYQYYTGVDWKILNVEPKYEKIFYYQNDNTDIEIKFICPDDLMPIETEDKIEYLIRITVEKIENEFALNPLYKTPFITNLDATFEFQSMQTLSDVAICTLGTTKNVYNQVYNNERVYGFFIDIEDSNNLYLALNEDIVSGDLNIYFDMYKSMYTSKSKLNISYLNFDGERSRWEGLKFEDHTHGLTGSGNVMLQIDKLISKTIFLNERKSWIRISSTLFDIDNLKAIHLNTVMTKQLEKFENRVVDTSKEYTEILIEEEDVISFDVWVNEVHNLNDVEIKKLRESGLIYKEEVDEEGRILSFRVKWENTSNLQTKSEFDRLFVFDKLKKQILFGDDKHGKKPPYGRYGLISYDYLTSKGKLGSVDRYGVKSLALPISGINKVYNFSKSTGAVDDEETKELMVRTSEFYKYRKKPFTKYDYENKILDRFRDLLDVECKISILEDSKMLLKIVVLSEDVLRSMLKPEQKKSIREYIETILPVSFLKNDILVEDPKIIEISYNIRIKLLYGKRKLVTDQINSSIEKYLHFSYGGYQENGWKIKTLPTISDLISQLESDKKFVVVSVDEIFKIIDGNKEAYISRAKMIEFDESFVIKNGKHSIEIMP